MTDRPTSNPLVAGLIPPRPAIQTKNLRTPIPVWEAYSQNFGLDSQALLGLTGVRGFRGLVFPNTSRGLEYRFEFERRVQPQDQGEIGAPRRLSVLKS